jgi:serine/threonine-protein kinase
VVLPEGAAGTGFVIDTIVANRYRIDGLIGRGGMASVFRAVDLELAEPVALKVFTQPFTDEGSLARFRQELKLSRMLIHPNIVRLYDIGVFQGYRYISMELLIGQGLDTMMGKSLELGAGLGYLQHACMALQAAHEQGIIHRDLKPANMFVIGDERLKILDFGIAKHQAAPGLTAVRSLAGTPEYMSPEQISDSSTVTKSTDLYALGIIAYEMFTGTRPFQHAELMPLLNMQLQQAPEPPTRRNPAMPKSLEKVILKLLEKQPENRFSSCQELAIELSRIRNQEIPSSA